MRRRRPWVSFTPGEKERAIRLYLAGATLQEAADRCWRSTGRAPTREAVRLWLRAAGIAPHQKVVLRERIKAVASPRRTAREVAEMVGTSVAYVCETCRIEGLPYRRRDRSESGRRVWAERVEAMGDAISERFAAGRTAHEAAADLGVAPITVYRHMRRHGIRPFVDRRTVEHRRAA